MIITAYHGTSFNIDFFNLDYLGKGQGQSIFAGIYFTTDKGSAEEYARLSSEKTGNPPRVYVAEIELNNPLYANKGRKFFTTRPAFIDFLKEYFPSWFINGQLNSVKVGYANEKFSTYTGQYSIIKYAASENNIPVTEIEEDLGYDGCIDGTDVIVTNPNSILSFEEVVDSDEALEASAVESLADRLIIDSKYAQNYKTMPGNRYKRRLRIRTEGGNRVWYDIDVNLFFNKDLFTWHVPVIGETDEYVVELQLEHFLPVLKDTIKNEGFSVKSFKNALTKAFRNLNVKVDCTCPDAKYRMRYWQTMKGDISGAPEYRPSDITNPKDKLGRGCKHVLFCLSNRIHLVRVARIFFNYCFNLYKTNKPLFERTIAKKLNITDEMVENRPLERREPKIQSLPEDSEQEEQPQEEPTENVEVTEVEKTTPEGSSTETFAGETYYSSYYKDATTFDDDQQYMIDTAKDNKIEVKKYITPKNSPEQIWEVFRDIQGHLKPEYIKILSDPDLSLQEHQILRESYLKGVNLFPYIGQSPDILKQLYLGSKQGIDPKELLIKGKNYRQIEQLRNIYKIDKDLFNNVKNKDLNYEQLKSLVKELNKSNN